MPLPEWLSVGSPIEPPEIGRYSRKWVSVAVDRLAALTVPRESPHPGIAIDPRAALLGFVGLIVCATAIRSELVMAVFLCISLLIASSICGRVRTVLFAALIAGGATAILIIPSVIWTASFGTVQSIHNLIIMTMRTAACISLGVGLYLSNRTEDLFSALRWFRVPSLFVMIILMTHRYLTIISRAAYEAHMARKSRVADDTDLASARKWLGEQIGALFIRSRDLGEEVHNAMIARGFDGEWIPRKLGRVRHIDVLWLISCVIIASVSIVIDRRLPL